MARRGKMPNVRRIDTTWWQIKRQRTHSTKPEFFQDIIESVSYPPRIELFSRRHRHGWDVWGNEVTCDINLFGENIIKSTSKSQVKYATKLGNFFE